MEKLTSIFAAVEHPDSGTAVLDKAVALARHFDARVELLVIQPLNRTAFLPRSAALGYPHSPCAPCHARARPCTRSCCAKYTTGNPIC